MNQMGLILEEINFAEAYYKEIVKVLEDSGLGYDLKQIQLEYRQQDKDDAYEAILICKTPCFHIKGRKTKYLYMHGSFTKLLDEKGYIYEPATSSRWARIAISEFPGFEMFNEPLQKLYEACLQASDTFGCCASYMECSDAKKCIKNDIMFAGRCAYRQNLIAGRIFYGKNRNI